MRPEPIELSYALFLLPRSRVAFRRWRWELWHGAQLLAAGWRSDAPHAQRALRVYAVRYAHRVYNLHALRPEAATAPEAVWGTQPITVESGDVRVRLVPRVADPPTRSRAAA